MKKFVKFSQNDEYLVVNRDEQVTFFFQLRATKYQYKNLLIIYKIVWLTKIQNSKYVFQIYLFIHYNYKNCRFSIVGIFL